MMESDIMEYTPQQVLFEPIDSNSRTYKRKLFNMWRKLLDDYMKYRNSSALPHQCKCEWKDITQQVLNYNPNILPTELFTSKFRIYGKICKNRNCSGIREIRLSGMNCKTVYFNNTEELLKTSFTYVNYNYKYNYISYSTIFQAHDFNNCYSIISPVTTWCRYDHEKNIMTFQFYPLLCCPLCEHVIYSGDVVHYSCEGNHELFNSVIQFIRNHVIDGIQMEQDVKPTDRKRLFASFGFNKHIHVSKNKIDLHDLWLNAIKQFLIDS